MVIALVALALVLALALVRAPQWLLLTMLGLTAILAVAGLALGGLERAVIPLIAYALALGLLVPAGLAAYQSSRVAPPLQKRRVRGGPIARRRRTTTKGGDPVIVPGNNEPLDIPGYDVLEKVGSGGMASVYKAERLSDGKIVALKVPMEQYVADAKFIRRFHREAEVAQRLDHVNIVQTFEHGSLGPQHYMVMEFVDGRSLEGYVEAGELTIDLSAAIMQRVADALQHIHAAGIIHRDIKPANIMIMKGGIKRKSPPELTDAAVKLMDFGIAGGKVLSRLTMTGARVGTPVYMSPEQARGLKIDHRSDTYSLGLVFYEMLTGQTAFKGGYEAIVHQQIFQTPAPPRQLNLRVPKALDQLVMRMIAKDPDERPTLAAVVEALTAADFFDAEGEELDEAIVLTVNSRQGVVRLLDTEGNLHLSLGDLGVAADAFSTAPVSVAAAPDGHLYAAAFEYRAGDESHRMITKLDPAGKVVSSFGPYGMKPGEFLYPISIAVGGDGYVYVLDSETHKVQRFDADGRFLAAFGGRGTGQGTFSDPRVIGVGPDGKVFVLDYGNRQVQRLTPDGTYETRWAFRLGSDQPGMRVIDGFAISSDGTLFISDATSGKIRSVTPDGKLGTTYMFERLQGEANDQLLDLGIDRAGVLYVARRGGHIIRRFAPDGTMRETVETYSPIVHMALHIKRRTTTLAEAVRA